MRGDSRGLVNPTWSKVKRSRFGVTAQAFEGGPPEPAGRPLEAVGNGSRRWMVARRGNAATEPGLQADSSASPVRSGGWRQGIRS